MKIIFMGSSWFGVPSLRQLVKHGHTVLCVVTQPDKKKNRGMHIEPTAVKEAGAELGITAYQPSDINTPASIGYLRALGPDLFVVIAYGQKLSQAVLDIPAIMPVNIHASLLPAYRGAAPINRAIMEGEKRTGVTLMKVTLRMDTGPIILQMPADILETDTAQTLSQRMSIDAGEILIQGIAQLAAGSACLQPQDESKASFAPKLKRSDGMISWNRPAQAIVNLIRGCSPWPGAFTFYKGKTLKIHKATTVSFSGSDTVPAGQIVHISREGIVVACAGGTLLIESVQMEGKRIISAGEFMSGYKVNVHDTFG